MPDYSYGQEQLYSCFSTLPLTYRMRAVHYDLRANRQHTLSEKCMYVFLRRDVTGLDLVYPACIYLTRSV